MNDCANENNDVNQRINNNKTTAIKYFDYKTKILGRTPNDNDMVKEEVVVPLKYLVIFGDLSLIEI